MKTIHIIGAGLIGQERMKAVDKLKARGHSIRIGMVFDSDHSRLDRLSTQYGFAVATDVDQLYSEPADLIVVACPHDVATEHACRALNAGRAVLVEKPLGRNREEALRIAAAAGPGGQVFVGLNYRFMRGISVLVADWRAARFGVPISLRFQLGHGGKPDDGKSWKLDPVRCGGGALLDPGIHLLDLVNVMTGGQVEVQAAHAWKGFWKTGIEEDVHLLMHSGPVTLTVEVSVVRWQSRFEVFALGTEAYGQLTGRGRSYGVQQYRRGPRWGWQHAPTQAASEELVVSDNCEDSFADELAACLGLGPLPELGPALLKDGLAAMELYRQARQRLTD